MLLGALGAGRFSASASATWALVPSRCPRPLDQLLRGGRVALGGRQEGDADLDRLLERHVDEARDVLVVPVATRVRDGAEQALRVRELPARPPVLKLPGGAGEPPRPARHDVVGSVDLPLGERAQQDPGALHAILLPHRRGDHDRDQIVEARAVDRRRHPVAEGREPQAAVRILGSAAHEEELAALPARAGQLLRELLALVVAQLAAGDARPQLLLVPRKPRGVDALPLPRDHGEPAARVGRDGYEPARRRELAARTPLDPASRGRCDAGAGTVEVGVDQAVQRDRPLAVRRRWDR